MGCNISKYQESSITGVSVKDLSQPIDDCANELSYVGEAVYQTLRKKHGKHHHTMWNITKSKMVGSIHQTPSKEVFLSKSFAKENIQNESHSNWFAEKMCEIMSKTTKW